MFEVRIGVYLKRLYASLCREPKSKGGGGICWDFFVSIFSILPFFPSQALTIAPASSLVSIAFFSYSASKTELPITMVAFMLQYGAGTKHFMLLSRVARNLSVGPCTLPVLSVAYCQLQFLAAMVKALDRFMP